MKTNYKNKTWNFRVLAVRMDVRNETKSEFSMRSHSLPGCVVGIARSSVGFERCDSLRSLVISTKGTSSCASVPHGGMTWSWTFWGTYTAPFLEHPMLIQIWGTMFWSLQVVTRWLSCWGSWPRPYHIDFIATEVRSFWQGLGGNGMEPRWRPVAESPAESLPNLHVGAPQFLERKNPC